MKTTREAAREESHKKLVASLQELLDKNYDAEKDYKIAMERAEGHDLKQFFKKQIVRRDHYSTELDKLIHSLNERPKERGSALGTLHRTWINLRSSVDKDTDKVLLEECLRGEKICTEEYEEKLSKIKFPPQIEEVLRKQLGEMEVTLSKVQTLKDIA